MEATFEPKTRVERVVTSGPMIIDGHQIELENNVWLVGNDDEVVIIDASHSSAAIAEAVAGRRVLGIICTHGHRDHINALDELRSTVDAPAYLHPGDGELWRKVIPTGWDRDLTDEMTLRVGDIELLAIHTPGHTPGSTCIYIRELGTLLSGDTLFPGGPGATRFEYASFPTIMTSITSRLFTLPPETLVLPGHGKSTTIGTESPNREAWLIRGY